MKLTKRIEFGFSKNPSSAQASKSKKGEIHFKWISPTFEIVEYSFKPAWPVDPKKFEWGISDPTQIVANITCDDDLGEIYLTNLKAQVSAFIERVERGLALI